MSDSKRVLIIDDDDLLNEMLCEQLQQLGGYQCIAATTGEAGVDLAKSGHFDLFLLDVDLPGAGGHEVCRALRAEGAMAPIIMLTADVSDHAAIESLDSGATDYVTKPFKLGVLLARIRAQIRQFERSDEAVLSVGPFAFRPGVKTLSLMQGAQDKEPAEVIRLTGKEAEILKFLYLHGGEVVGRDTLLNEVWGYNANVTTHTLETHVYRLRQKMECDPSCAKILLTEPGGYRLQLS